MGTIYRVAMPDGSTRIIRYDDDGTATDVTGTNGGMDDPRGYGPAYDVQDVQAPPGSAGQTGTNPALDDPRGYGDAYNPSPPQQTTTNPLVDDPRGYGPAYDYGQPAQTGTNPLVDDPRGYGPAYNVGPPAPPPIRPEQSWGGTPVGPDYPSNVSYAPGQVTIGGVDPRIGMGPNIVTSAQGGSVPGARSVVIGAPGQGQPAQQPAARPVANATGGPNPMQGYYDAQGRFLDAAGQSNREKFAEGVRQYNETARALAESQQKERDLRARGYDIQANQEADSRRQIEGTLAHQQATLAENARQFGITSGETARQFDVSQGGVNRRFDVGEAGTNRRFDVGEAGVNRRADQANYSTMALGLLNAASNLRGPADYFKYNELTSGGRDVFQQLYGNQVRPDFSAPTGQLQPAGVGDVLTRMGLPRAPGQSFGQPPTVSGQDNGSGPGWGTTRKQGGF